MKSTDQDRRKVNFGKSCCSAVKRICHFSVHSVSKLGSFTYAESLSILYYHLLLWIIFSVCSTEYNTGETSKPLNRAAIKGENVQLNCSTQDQYNGFWKYARPFQGEERIYDGYKVVSSFKSIYSVNDSVKGHFNLLFTSSESTSGTYVCQPDLETADQSAEVIVLDAQPNCSDTVTAGIVNATCSIGFSGNWAPEIQWHDKNGRLETNDTTTIQNSRVISFLSMPLSQTDPGALHILTCAPKFMIESKPQRPTATNVPKFPNNCTLTVGLSTIAPSTQPTSPPPSSPPPSPPYYIIGICVCVIACVFATSAFIVMLYKRKKIPKAKDRSEAVPMRTKLQNATLT